MTYPPQQPGQPDPYGQHPGGYPPPGGGYPQQPPAGQQPYGQQPPPGQFGQQPPPGGPPHGPPPGGQPPYGPPPGGGGGNRKGLWAGLGIGAVVVVAALLITGLAAPGWMLGGGSGPSGVAQQAVQALNNNDATAVNDVSCDKDSPSEVKEQQSEIDESGIQRDASLDADPKVNGDTATVPVTLKITGGRYGDEGKTGHGTLKLQKQDDGTWCVDELEAH